MEYDTDHVQFGNESKQTVSGLSTFTSLIENTDLARLYALLRENAMTAPTLVERANVSKKTVYSYLSDLERAGLASELENNGEASAYQAEDFEMTVKLRGVEISITPELIDIFARAGDSPVIKRVIDEYGVVPLVFTYDLVKGHKKGDVTVRQISQLTGLSSGTTYDLVEALYKIFDFGDNSEFTTFTSEDVEQEDDLVEDSTDE